jgi:hypothetical protein
MRNPAELIAMLTEHGVVIGHIPGGKPVLLGTDVAAALGMMHDKPAAAMLLAKYALDRQALTEFARYWQMAVDAHGYSERWEADSRQTMLADYALSEWIDSQRCRTCRGVGHQVAESGKVRPCASCEGLGLRKVGLRQPARALGMSAETYRKSAWMPRVEWARRELQYRELNAITALKRLITG